MEIAVIVLAVLFIISNIFIYFVCKHSKQTIEENVRLLNEVEKNAEETIIEARKKTEFVANMSHEIRVPMNAISCATELLLKEDLPHTAQSYLNILKNSSDSLLEMVNGILDFSKMDAGKLSLIENEYAVREGIEDVKSILAAKLVNKNIAFTIDIAPGIPKKLIGDSVRIKQILINLLNNAIKYTNEGEVAVSLDYERLSKETVDLFVTVKDTGAGIPPTAKEALIADFNSENINSHMGNEIGMGLSIVKSLVNLMGGHIEFESELGKGTTFRVNIHQKVAEHFEPLIDSERSKALSLCVLVWEDNEYYKSNFKAMLECLNVTTKLVNSRHDLEHYLATTKVDYVISCAEHYEDTLASINRFSPSTLAVKIVELGEPSSASFNGNFVEIKRPVDIFQIVDLFKTKEFRELHAGEAVGKLMAPNASILLTDDNKVNLKVAKSLLETFGSKITAVQSGKEAVDLIKEGNHFDLIFMDHMMPGMDGIEASHKIWEAEGDGAHTPIIALTANVGNEAEKLFFEAGLNDFIPKPIVMQNLNFVMQKWLPKEKQQYSDAETMGMSPFLRMHASALKPEWGLAHVFDDKKMYCGMLRVFLEQSKETLSNIEATKTDTEIERGIDSLYKLSISIGATRFPEIINDIKYNISTGKKDTLKAKVKQSIEEYESLCKEINEYLEQEDSVDIMDLINL